MIIPSEDFTDERGPRLLVLHNIDYIICSVTSPISYPLQGYASLAADVEVGCPSQNMQKHFPTIYLASDIKSFARASQASISKYAVPTSQYLPPDLQIAVATFCAIPPTCGRSNIYANVYVFTFPSRDHLHTDTALEKRYRSFGHCP